MSEESFTPEGGLPVSRKLVDLYSAIFRARSVTRHYEFYQWLQNDMQRLVAHDVLIAIWGDFATGELYLDCTSSVPGLKTQSFMGVPEIAELAARIYRNSFEANESCLVLRQHEYALPEQYTHIRPVLALSLMKSALLYRMRNKRGTHDCLYIFASRRRIIKADTQTLELLMPHIDLALRRLDCNRQECRLAGTEKPPTNAGLPGVHLTDREREVLRWVCEGKSNHEIGMILNISHNTVKNHLKRIFNKLSVTSRSQAVRAYANHYESQGVR